MVIEFQRSSQGASRHIALKHNAQMLPPQLAGRVSPQDWQRFMGEVQQLAEQHPYVVRPSAGKMCGWLGGAVMGAVLGFCCIDPDGGDYGVWVPQVEQCIARWQPVFNHGGAALSLKRAQSSYWIQVDIDPNVVAAGVPVGGKQDPTKPAMYGPPGGEGQPYKGDMPPYSQHFSGGYAPQQQAPPYGNTHM